MSTAAVRPSTSAAAALRPHAAAPRPPGAPAANALVGHTPRPSPSPEIRSSPRLDLLSSRVASRRRVAPQVSPPLEELSAGLGAVSVADPGTQLAVASSRTRLTPVRSRVGERDLTRRPASFPPSSPSLASPHQSLPSVSSSLTRERLTACRLGVSETEGHGFCKGLLRLLPVPPWCQGYMQMRCFANRVQCPRLPASIEAYGWSV